MTGIEHAVLHVVTNDEVLGRADFFTVAAGIMHAGGAGLAFHIRGGRTGASTLLTVGERLLPDAATSGASLVVNDRVDVALGLPSHGVHLGRRSLPAHRVRALVGDTMTVGVSCHSAADVRTAKEAGADYAFFGNVYPTASHPGRDGVGVAALAGLAGSAPRLPVVAIGGITPATLREVVAAGAAGVAVIRGVWDAEDPAGAVHGYISGLAALRGAARSGATGPSIDRPAERA